MLTWFRKHTHIAPEFLMIIAGCLLLWAAGAHGAIGDLVHKAIMISAGLLHAHAFIHIRFGKVDFRSEEDPWVNGVSAGIYVLLPYLYSQGWLS